MYFIVYRPSTWCELKTQASGHVATKSFLSSQQRTRRILISQDVSTMMGSAVSRIKAGKAMPGVFLIPDTVPIGAAIEAIALIVECSAGKEWNDRVEYLPL